MGISGSWSVERPAAEGVSEEVIKALQSEGIYTNEIIFKTTGNSFAPVIIASGSPEVLWTFSDGTISTSLTPSKSFGIAGVRKQRLKVTPWSAIQRINLGYYGEDGGAGDIEHVVQQNVSAINNLHLVSATLVDFCACHCPLVSVDFHDFLILDTIELYNCPNLIGIVLTNTPQLKRACFEYSDVGFLDFSTSPLIEDVRGSSCSLIEIRWGDTGQHLWHMCVRENSSTLDVSTWPSMDQFPVLIDMWISGNGLIGDMVTNSTVLGNVWLGGNNLSTLDVSNGFPSGSHYVHCPNGSLTSFIFDNCPGLNDLDLHNNSLPSEMIDTIFISLDAQGRTNGVVNLSQNSFPSPTGEAAIASLEGKSWGCTYDQSQTLALNSATIENNGSTWTLVFNRAVSIGAGGSAGFSGALTTGGVFNLTYTSGANSTTLIYESDITALEDETLSDGLDYTQPGDGLEDSNNDDLASFTNFTVTNNTNKDSEIFTYFEFTTNDQFWDGSVVCSSGTVTWDFGDGTQYIGVDPGVRDFGSAATRTHRVTFSDPDSLTRINLNESNPTSVIGVELNNFTNLTFIHFYNCRIAALDIGGCPALSDLHLNQNIWAAAVGDQILSDLANGTVSNGDLYMAGSLHSEGGQAEVDRQTLLGRSWSINW